MLYTRARKSLLCVRATTCTDVCYMELNYPSFEKFILKMQWDYLNRTIPILEPDDPLKQALELCQNANTNGYRTLMKVFNLASNPWMT